MVITLAPDLEVALQEAARRQGVAPEELVHRVLRARLLSRVPSSASQDDWERNLRQAATDCGVSLSHEALSSEGLYD
jgi:hypothetical protein